MLLQVGERLAQGSLSKSLPDSAPKLVPGYSADSILVGFGRNRSHICKTQDVGFESVFAGSQERIKPGDEERSCQGVRPAIRLSLQTRFISDDESFSFCGPIRDPADFRRFRRCSPPIGAP